MKNPVDCESKIKSCETKQMARETYFKEDGKLIQGNVVTSQNGRGWKEHVYVIL